MAAHAMICNVTLQYHAAFLHRRCDAFLGSNTMKIRQEAIKSAGLTLLYEPDWPTDPVVDIVLVHGIGGHPVRTWTYRGQDHAPTADKPTGPHPQPGIKRRLTKVPPETRLRRSNSEPVLVRETGPLSRSRTLLGKSSTKSTSRLNLDGLGERTKQSPPSRSRSLLRKASAKSSTRLALADLAEPASQSAGPDVDAFWPLDFLPASCPNVRIFTWGYQTLVADGKPLRHQGDVFAHSEELLVELAGTRAGLGAAARPIIFIAHSTGGVLVKEVGERYRFYSDTCSHLFGIPQVLRLSEAERDGPLKRVLLSTSAVVFLGSPHRGTEHCNLGDAVRSMASVTMAADPNDPVLQELCGANTVEVELGRQTFVRLWNDYNFKIKTFQESVIPSYRNAELRAETTMRRLASFIGDPRESAETIYALHDDICKFGSAGDAGYRALARTLAAFVSGEEDGRHELNTKETECLSALAPPQPSTQPETHPTTVYPGTCLWLYDLHDFQAWLHRNGPNKHKILWLRGTSGCGKSVLLRSLRNRLEKQWKPAGASFIWSATQPYDIPPDLSLPDGREANPIAPIARNLFAQLFLQDPRLRKALLALYSQPRSGPRTFDDAQIVSLFADYYVKRKVETSTRRTFIFVEIADDAGPTYVHELLDRLSHLAHNSDFSICVASGYREEIIEEENVISIPVHLRNNDDILRYVKLNLVCGWKERNRIITTVVRKSGGVFLWAEIVVNILNAAMIEGATQEMIEYTLGEVPSDLHGLYEWMLSTLNDRERAESLILFQWAMLAAEPMRLNDLLLAVRLTEPNPFCLYRESGPLMGLNIGKPFSMRELRQLRNSEITSDTPSQFHRWLRARSIGLLELRSDNSSRQAAAHDEPLGLQRVHPIHGSVRTFFLSGRGFACLARGNPSIPPSLPIADFIDITHYTLLRACLTCLNMRDFESLGHGAHRRRKAPAPPSPSRSPTSPSSALLTKLETTLSWHPPPTVSSQRHLIMSSFPFLEYAVSHLLFHLLSPQPFRYFLPQRALLAALSANKFRLWKRWTSLLGTYDPDAIIAKHASPSSSSSSSSFSYGRGGTTAALLSPVYGARFRLERVLRKLNRLAASESYVARRSGVLEPVTPVGLSLSVDHGGDEKKRRKKGREEEEEEEEEEDGAPEEAWVPGSTPGFRLPSELNLPLPSVGGSSLSPVERVDAGGENGVGLAV
ncbi:uncharacterized protein B0T15DRAFT_574885 [Chaetomium strumarium]|uniref:Nephrocystin 3-like N-terminal domain-containing protein n=1 Tax=Chaetomium strumarium TaxID=1170767 RepID=A0AAJ0GSZ1_9PEZI|nr:hypothetical protein B0T15DRAFT_574885 [Chaetomium strumarium]